jgi:hypothetical protein
MKAGKPLGAIRVSSSALLPADITGEWRVADDGGKTAGSFIDAPQIRIQPLSPGLLPNAGSAQEEAVLQRLSNRGYVAEPAPKQGYAAGMVVWAAKNFNHRDVNYFEDRQHFNRIGVRAGSRGTVVSVDQDGDVEVQFEGHEDTCFAFPKEGDLALDGTPAAIQRRQLAQLEVGGLPGGSFTALQVVRALVLERLRSVQQRFPSASEDDLCEALVHYSPESWLYAKGLSADESRDPFDAQQWDKYQGALYYGTDQAFHDGSAPVLGVETADDDAMAAITLEVLEQGEAGDRFNLWYFRFCAAAEQVNYNEKGELRENASTHKPKVLSYYRVIHSRLLTDHSVCHSCEPHSAQVLDEGHGGMWLADFTREVNAKLEKHGSHNRVTDARVLGLRLYTASTFRRLNTALRDKGTGKASGELGFKACVQSARKCLLDMQAIPRPESSTFRGATGFLGHEFEQNAMGMDYAFFSASTDEGVAAEFAGSVAHSVLFEVEFLRGCPGVDVSMLSVFPGEKEVLYPPCTGLSLSKADEGAGARTGAEAGRARVRVSPTAAR